MQTRTVKTLSAIALTGAGTALVVGFHTPDAAVTAGSTALATSTTPTTTTTTPSTTPAATATPEPAATTDPTTATTDVAAASVYADGTWTGAAVDEPWGTFQVEATVSGGTVTDIVVVSAPRDGHSNRINSQAVPILTEAAIAAQSADIDLLSGATWTSESYVTSLQAALDDAQAAANTTG